MLDFLKRLRGKLFKPKEELISFPELFEHFQGLLQDHQKVMELMADLGEKSGGDYIFDRKYLADSAGELQSLLLRLVKGLNLIASNRYPELYQTLDRIFLPLEAELRGRLGLSEEMPYAVSLEELPLDHPELCGGKAGTLGEIKQRLHLPVPQGFVITSRAYRRFLEHNQADARIHACLETWISGKADERTTARQIQYSLLAGVIPQDVLREIKGLYEKGPDFWAVRSSAYGEDGELSFAGLHESHLHVPSRAIPEVYKKVVASLYSPEALSYRRQMGMIGEEAAMPVLCQEIVSSRASGVVHTLSLEDPESDALIIFASLGLGRTVMEGRSALDRYVVDRNPPHLLRQAEIARKETLVRAAAGGGEEEAAVPLEEQNRPCLTEEAVQTLARWSLTLERYYKRPQEIEWSLDEEGRLWLLQSRRLAPSRSAPPLQADISEAVARYPVLLKDRGTVAHAGVGAGPVCLVTSDEEMERFPEGAVLLTRYTAPWLARIVPRAAAIISERGSAAGHLATIAREFRVPALVGVEGAADILTEGREITVDAHHRLVYQGRVKELIQYELIQSAVFEDTPEFRLLRRMLRRIAPLSLIDPQAPDFTPEGCHSVHDVIRFIHEKAVQELLDLPRFLKRFKGAQIWTLISPVPIGLKIWDLGGGIAPEARGREVTQEQIRSLPLKALWEGVSAPGVWSTEPIQVDFKGLMSSLTKTFSEAGAGAYTGFNLAVINENYVNLHLRLGYHFNLIDARMDPDPHHNHIYFRFAGGVTDITRRSRRAQLLAQILSRFHFKVDIKGDLVVARVLHLPQEEIGRRLQVLGQLIGFTRQLDIQLRTDEDIPQFIEDFFAAPSLEDKPGQRRKK